MSNVNNLINSLNNKLLTVLNNITTTTSLAASYGMGKYLPLSYNAPLIFATNTQVLKKKVSGTNYIVFTYTFYFLDNVGGAQSEVGLQDIFNEILLNYTDYLDLYSSNFPNPITILTAKGAKCEGVEFTYDLDKINLPTDPCCDIILIEGPAGTSGVTGSSGTSGSSGVDGSSGFSGSSGTSGSSGKDGLGGAQGNWGTFWDTSATQTAANTTTAYAIALGNSDPNNYGVSIVSGDRITFANPGVYNIQYSLQLTNTSNDIHNINVWLRKNDSGTSGDLADSNSQYAIINRHGSINGQFIATVNYVLKLNAGDFIQLMWQTESTSIYLETIPQGTTPTTPVSPCAIVTATQVMYTQAGSSGSSGVSGTSGSSGLSGTSGSSGVNGADGVIGSSGSSGINGTSGSSGTSGPAGVNGTSGSSGINGVNGTSGSSGSSGVSGTSGSSGVNGAIGPTGVSGSSGSSGVNGGPGTSGSSGTNGAAGPAGAPGTSGSSGTNGNPGVSGSSGSSGTNGAPGVSGSSGSSGTNGLGVAGAAFGVTIDGSGEVPTTGSVGYVRVPYNCTINTWSMAANATGSAVVDVKRSGTSIVGAGNKPTLTSGQFALTNVSGWTSVAVVANDLIEFNLDSISTITRLNLSIIVTRS